MKLGDLEYPSLKGKVSDAEWQARVDLAAIFRLIPLMGWWDLSQAPASARIQDGSGHYLINPVGFMFEEITASSLVKVTLEGEYAAETPLTFMQAGWYPMRAIHAAHPQANYVIHSHDDFAAAFSARKDELLPITQFAAFALADGVAYHDFDGVETHEDRMASLQQSLGSASMMILRNHGMVTLGPVPYAALARMANLRKCCVMQLQAGQAADLRPIEPTIVAGFVEEIRRGIVVDDLWGGLLRKLDRLDPTYKD